MDGQKNCRIYHTYILSLHVSIINIIVLSISQAVDTITQYLHDTVYLYLRTVNQTLAEGDFDYRDGRLIRNKTIGQRFVGKHRLYECVVLT